jgi:hypothetical protein
VSLIVQRSVSSQAMPSCAGGSVQLPVTGSQVPSTWHSSLAVQVTLVPMHVPAWHASPVVQRSSSLQEVASGAAGFEQTPVTVSQVPARWHWSLALQMTFVPRQVPSWQLSPDVHGSLSLHEVPSGAAGSEQVPRPGLQMPAT